MDDELRDVDPVFRAVTSWWLEKIKAAERHKRKVFGHQAKEILSFYTGPKSWDEVMATTNFVDEPSDPSFKVSVNKTYEFVTLFGPSLYYDNPVRTVKPRMPAVVPPIFFGSNLMAYQSLLNQENIRVQTDGLRSVLLEAYLNWTPTEFKMYQEARQGVDDALITGRGCAWTELYSPPGTDMKVVRTVYDSVDHLFVDPDAHSYNKALWIVRKCVEPVWQVERDRGYKPGTLRGNMESQARMSDVEVDEDIRWDRKRGITNDLLVYFKIYSKMGIGGRLSKARKDWREPLDIFGDYCYLEVAEDIPYLLNLPPHLINDPSFSNNPQEIFDTMAWPTPFWGNDSWPCSVLDFRPVANSVWPMAPLSSAMGELRFLNWTASFLMGKIRNTCRDFLAIKKEAGEEIKEAILGGKDLTLLELDPTHESINDLVSFLQHPEVNGDIWKMIDHIEARFDKRTGLNALMYGESPETQIRSSAEFKGRNKNMDIRPKDMRECAVAWQSEIAAKEALCARYHLVDTDVLPALGEMGAWAWGQYVHSKDINVITRQLEYRIESATMERPNKEWEAETMNTAFQGLAPILQAYGQTTGDMEPLNNLLADYAKAQDLDPGRYQLRSPMMGMQPPPPGPEGVPGSSGLQHQQQATTNVPPPG